MQSYDVVIVGAGPGGLKCAEILTNANKKVLVLEQNKIIGPKVCAGGLAGHDLKYLKIPDRLLDFKFRELTLHTPFNKDKIKLDNYFVYTIDRKKLGQWQLRKLKKTNIEVKTNSKVTEIRKNFVIINNSEKIKFKYLVGADGSNSLVRKHLGLKTNKTISAMQYVISTKKYKKFEVFYDSKLFCSGYAWIFPHNDYVSIGCGCNPKVLPANKLHKNFNTWIKNKGINISKAEYQSQILNFDYKGCKFNNVFLVGDAAGLSSGLTGEGIYQAIVSGEEVAKLILDKHYVCIKLRELVKLKKLHNNILSVLERSGPIRKLEYELIALLFKNNSFDKKAVEILA